MNFGINNSDEISILHIEDSDADALIINMILKKTNLNIRQIYRSHSLEQGVELLDRREVHLVLLDLYLPDSEGLETLKRLRQHCTDVAIIIVTGSDDGETGLLSVKHGAQDYLAKDELNASLVSRAVRYSIERHIYDQNVIELANTDLLTGLPNRARFMEYLSTAISMSKRMSLDLSLLFIDCDNFKRINDTYGHIRGDEFLIDVAQILRRSIRSTDFAARLGGDEFVVAYQTNDEHAGSPLTLADKILNELKTGTVLACDETLEIRCSIGVTSYDGRGPEPLADRLIYEADAAMYLSKERGGSCVSFFDQALEKKANRRLKLLQELNLAKVEKDFYLVYQPIVHTHTGEISGLEALLRWKHPSGEFISPAEFIPLLEETGYIQEVGRWVIKTALHDFETLMENNHLSRRAWISLNVSPLQLHSPDFVSTVAHLVHQTLLEPSQVHFEITEGLFMEKSEFILKTLFQITTIGCKWTIDDFGVGYSSMNYLKDLPVDTLKIDKSFVDNICSSKRDIAIVRAIAALAHTIGMHVVCEGVETREQHKLIKSQDIEFSQGYLFYRPMEIALLIHQINQNASLVIPFKR